MKMARSLLLGSAAGLVAVGAAQAADLPVKAKPVEYVKVCSLYGAGYWYVPGTDTCIKLGGLLRFQMEWNANAGGASIGSGGVAAAGRFDRTDTNQLAYRSRAGLSMDLRTQTEYGTLRSYFRGGFQITSPGDNGTANVYWDRGFLQFMGFTAGLAQSFFDLLSLAPFSYANTRNLGDTGATGINLFAYTMQLGNGLSATLSLEDGGDNAAGNNTGGTSTGRGHLVVNANMPSFVNVGAVTNYDNAGARYPDIVAALRLDQAWGSAQIAGAVHDTSGGYYGTANSTVNGHPADAVGFAITGGVILNNFLGMKGDTFGVQGTFSQGASGYATRALGAWQVYGSGNTEAMGWLVDGVYSGSTAAGTGTGVFLTDVWSFNAVYEHLWNAKWRTSIYGGATGVTYGASAKAAICNGATPAVFDGQLTFPNPATCNPNFSWWSVGTRTQWNPHPDIDIGLDVLYTQLNSSNKGAVTENAANGARPAGAYQVQDQGVWSAMMRWQRNFIP